MNCTILKVRILLLALLCTATVHGQRGGIKGAVSDEFGPLSFATVEIAGKGVVTDSLGHFTVEDLMSGNYRVKASYVGYMPFSRQVAIVADEITEIAIVLKASTLIDEVVVTGTLKPSYVSESPVRIDVLSARQLESFMPSASSSVVEGIQMINGVEEVVACGVCYTNSIAINGLPGQYTAILMDGMPIYGNLASVYGLNGIPNMIVERYEVIRGPSSTLYGSEAVGGVINIITKDPGGQPLLDIDIMGTSHLESFGNIAAAPRIGKTAGYVGLNYAYINDFDDENGDGFGDVAQMDRYSLFTKWDIHRKSGKRFSLAGKIYYEDRRNGVEEYLADRAYRDLRGSDSVYGESIYTNRYELFGTYEVGFVDDLRVDFSYSHHDQNSYYGADLYEATQDIGFANVVWNKVKGDHDLTAGGTLRYQAYDDNTPATEEQEGSELVNTPDEQFIPGVFVQDEWSPGQKWSILPGVRLDYFREHGPILAPRLSVRHDFTQWTQVRINFGTGFRIVNLFTEDHAFVTGQREVVIEGDLNPERSYNAALNIHHVFTLGNGSGTIDLDAYYTHFTNKIIPDYDTPGQIVYRNSEGSATTMGIGPTLSYNLPIPLGFQAAFNLQQSTQEELNDEGVLEDTNIEFSPDWTALATVNYRIPSIGLDLAYTAQWTGPMQLPEVFDLDESGNVLPEPRPVRSKPFSFHTIQVSKDLGKSWKVYCGIQNLFNERQSYSPLSGYNDPSASPGFSELFDTAYSYGIMQEREFYIGLRWTLDRKAN